MVGSSKALLALLLSVGAAAPSARALAAGLPASAPPPSAASQDPGDAQDRAVPDRAALTAMMARCGSQVPWHRDWDSAAAAAREKDGRVLVYFHTQANYALPDAFRLGPAMDPAVLAILDQRMALLDLQPGTPTPFTPQDSYGVGPMAFGASLLIVSPEGEVLGSIGKLVATVVREFLVRGLADLPVATPPAGLDLAAQAEFHLSRGEDRRAELLLAEAEGAHAHLLRARLHRHRREGEAALRELEAAAKADPEAFAIERAMEEAAVLGGLGRQRLALEALARVPEGDAWSNMARLQESGIHADRDLPRAKVTWSRLVTEAPDDPSAWLSAAMLLYADLMAKAEKDRTGWPDEAEIRMHWPRPWAPLPASKVAFASDTALEYLLHAQNADGSWSVGFGAGNRRATQPLIIGITAWCARALLPHHQDARVQDAVRRSLEFVHTSRRLLSVRGEPFAAMDYFVWSKPSLLLFLAEAIECGVADEDEWRPVMQTLVAELQGKQRGGGGWCYYQGGDLDNLEARLEISFSFVTAFVLHALFAAEAVGVDLPEDMVAEGLRCLEVCGNDDGSFEYTLMHAAENAPRRPTPSGAAGRGPLCSLALQRWDRTGLDRVREALDTFLRYRDTFTRQRGKTLMHCGAEGEGSHYLMFDYCYCAEAVAALPAAQRPKYRKEILDQILTSRTQAGSYVDNPLIGDDFGTAAALWAFHRLGAGGR